MIALFTFTRRRKCVHRWSVRVDLWTETLKIDLFDDYARDDVDGDRIQHKFCLFVLCIPFE